MTTATPYSLLEICRHLLAREAAAIAALASGLSAEAGAAFLQAVELLVNCRGHVITSGAGTTGMVARRLAHLLCNVGCPALFLHAGDSLHGSSGAIKDEDICIILSKNGETRETRELAQIIAARRGTIIAITANPDSTLAKLSRVVLLVQTPPEIDPYGGLMGVGSSLATAAMCDALVYAVLETKGASPNSFLSGHPGGIIEHLDDPQG
jgi:arabinose-5-phosphate isomerase